MEPVSDVENEKANGRLGFILIKGDLGRAVTVNDPSMVPNDPEAEKKAEKWLTSSLKEYADKICGLRVEVLQTKVIKGLSKDQLVELYGEDHGKWLDSLSDEDFDKQMAVYDGTMAPIILATVRVDTATSTAEAEKELKRVRDTLRSDWHGYQGKEEISLPGGSKLMLSAMHVGNYDKDRKLLQEFGLA